MPIQIIDGFKLGTSKPIDDRIVGSGSTFRDNITYKYDGLLVVDTKNHTPYVWNQDSATWSSIIQSTSTNTSGTYNSITEKKDSSNKYHVYIGSNPSTANTTDKVLDIIGGLKSDFFHGDGSGITNINPSNVSVGSAVFGQVLQLTNINNKPTPTWSTISAGSNIVSTSVTPTTNYYIGFIDNLTSNISKIYNQVGVGLNNGVFYLNGIGLSSSIATFSRVAITNLNVSGAATFSRVGITDLNVSGAATFSRVDITDLNVSRAATFSRVFITGLSASAATFSTLYIPSTTSDKMVLTSNSTGLASWGAVPPVGSVIIWAINILIPIDYKICNGTGYIYIAGNYRSVPDLNDRILSGVSTTTSITSYGQQSPGLTYSFTLSISNLPKHRHSVSTTYNPSQKITATSTSTFSDTVGHTHMIQTQNSTSNGGNMKSGSGGNYSPAPSTGNTKVSGTVTTSTAIDGTTDDMTRYHGPTLNQAIIIPLLKGYKVVFLMKFNPGALPSTEGHWKPTL